MRPGSRKSILGNEKKTAGPSIRGQPFEVMHPGVWVRRRFSLSGALAAWDARPGTASIPENRVNTYFVIRGAMPRPRGLAAAAASPAFEMGNSSPRWTSNSLYGLMLRAWPVNLRCTITGALLQPRQALDRQRNRFSASRVLTPGPLPPRQCNPIPWPASHERRNTPSARAVSPTGAEACRREPGCRGRTRLDSTRLWQRATPSRNAPALPDPRSKHAGFPRVSAGESPDVVPYVREVLPEEAEQLVVLEFAVLVDLLQHPSERLLDPRCRSSHELAVNTCREQTPRVGGQKPRGGRGARHTFERRDQDQPGRASAWFLGDGFATSPLPLLLRTTSLFPSNRNTSDQSGAGRSNW